MNNTLVTSIAIIAVLVAISWIASLAFSDLGFSQEDTVVIIGIKGTIMGEPSGGFGTGGVAASQDIVALIKQADEDDSVKAIVLEINSGGGSPVASDEIAEAVLATNKPVVAWIREAGASGAYWIASSTDYIIANRMSITGSIGVISSYLEFSGFLSDHNVTYQRLVAGELKDTGTPLKPLTVREEELLQGKINQLHSIFIDEVSANRQMEREQVALYADGMFLLGTEALNAGLVDELGGLPQVTQYLNSTHNITASYVHWETSSSFADLFSGVATDAGFATGKGIASTLIEQQGRVRT